MWGSQEVQDRVEEMPKVENKLVLMSHHNMGNKKECDHLKYNQMCDWRV